MSEHKTVNQIIILDFKKYILEKLDNIKLIESADKELQQKLLYLAYLDGLAGSRYKGSGNKKAFLDVISSYSSWGYSDKICPLALKKLSDNHPEHVELKNFAENSYNNMINLGGDYGAAQVPLDNIPSKMELSAVWPQDWMGNSNSPNQDNLSQIIL